MPQAILFLDANVLYSACCRDLLLELALSGLCRCRWSEQVLAETRRALLRQRPDISGHNVDRLFALMSQAYPDALTQTRRPPLPTPIPYADPADIHVVHAAYAAHATTILTFNLKHFRASALATLDLHVLSPDTWLTELLEAQPAHVLQAIETCRLRLRRPNLSQPAHLQAMRRAGLVRLATHLSE